MLTTYASCNMAMTTVQVQVLLFYSSDTILERMGIKGPYINYVREIFAILDLPCQYQIHAREHP